MSLVRASKVLTYRVDIELGLMCRWLRYWNLLCKPNSVELTTFDPCWGAAREGPDCAVNLKALKKIHTGYVGGVIGVFNGCNCWGLDC